MVEALKRYHEYANGEIARGLAGLDALGNRYREEEKPLKRLGAAEVVEEVVHSFAVHSAVHARMALTALMFAAMPDKGKKSVVEKKGVQAEMEAIEEFAADKEVCSNGLSALALMSEVGAAQKVVTKYGVSSILSAMRRHKEEKEVQLYALKALNGLCEVREVSEAVGREGGIPAVVEVWRLFAEEEEMVKLGASVLKMVTRVSEATADELIACNAVQTMLEVLEQYASEALVMAALCELVAVMATNAQAKKRFLDEDVVSTLVVMITTGGKEDAEMIDHNALDTDLVNSLVSCIYINDKPLFEFCASLDAPDDLLLPLKAFAQAVLKALETTEDFSNLDGVKVNMRTLVAELSKMEPWMVRQLSDHTRDLFLFSEDCLRNLCALAREQRTDTLCWVILFCERNDDEIVEKEANKCRQFIRENKKRELYSYVY